MIRSFRGKMSGRGYLVEPVRSVQAFEADGLMAVQWSE